MNIRSSLRHYKSAMSQQAFYQQCLHLTQLPETETLKKIISRIRRRNLPPKKKKKIERASIALSANVSRGVIPTLRQWLDGGARESIFVKMQKPYTVFDGTFKVSPTKFTQLFTIIGLQQENSVHEENTTLPFICEFHAGKEQNQYAVVSDVKLW